MSPCRLIPVIVALLLAACAPADPDGDAASADAVGRTAYLSHCAACHQPDGRGMGRAFPPLAGVDWLREQPTEAAIEVVLRGMSGPVVVDGVRYDGVMPAFSHLPDQRIAAILTYVYSNWGNDGREVTAEQVAEVRAASAR